MPANSVIQLRRGTAAQWTSANPVLEDGEPGYETDTGKEKRGDGSTAWTSLAYPSVASVGGANALLGWKVVTDPTYGAKGDGTTNDWPAISAAIAAGGTVYFPAATYSCQITNSGYQAVPANTRLAGIPGGSIVSFKTDGTASYLAPLANGGDNVTVEGLTFRRASNNSADIFTVLGHNALTFRSCVFDGVNGTYATGCSVFRLGSDNGITDGLTVVDCTVQNAHYGMWMSNTSTATLTNLTVRGCRFSGNDVTDLELNSPNGAITDVVVEGCRFASNINAGTIGNAGWALGLANVKRVKFHNNYVSNYKNEAIHLEDRTSDVAITANEFAFCAQLRAAYLYGFAGVTRVRVANNVFDGTLNTAQAVFTSFFAASSSVTITSAGAASVGSGVTLAVSALPVTVPSGTVLTFTGGGVLTTTGTARAGTTSLTGTLATAAVANGNTASAFLTVSGLPIATVCSYIKLEGNQFFAGNYCDAGTFSSVTAPSAIGNDYIAAGSVSGTFSTPSRSQTGLAFVNGMRSVCVGNSFVGFNQALPRQDNALAFGHGSVVSSNSFYWCNVAINALNAGAVTIANNMIDTCVTPLATGTGSNGNGVVAHPLVIVGNHAYGCTNAMEVYGQETVIAAGTASIGTGVTLTVGLLPTLIPTGTVLTFTGGGVFTLTADAARGASSIVGNLTTATVASTESAVAYLALSTNSGESRRLQTANADGFYGASGYAVQRTASVISRSASYRVLMSDDVILMTVGSTTATLPPAAVTANRIFTVSNTSAGSVTVAAASGNVAGSSTATVTAGTSGRFVSDGSNYFNV